MKRKSIKISLLLVLSLFLIPSVAGASQDQICYPYYPTFVELMKAPFIFPFSISRTSLFWQFFISQTYLFVFILFVFTSSAILNKFFAGKKIGNFLNKYLPTNLIFKGLYLQFVIALLTWSNWYFWAGIDRKVFTFSRMYFPSLYDIGMDKNILIETGILSFLAFVFILLIFKLINKLLFSKAGKVVSFKSYLVVWILVFITASGILCGIFVKEKYKLLDQYKSRCPQYYQK